MGTKLTQAKEKRKKIKTGSFIFNKNHFGTMFHNALGTESRTIIRIVDITVVG